MKLIYSLFLLVTLGLLVKEIPSSAEPLLTAREIDEVNRRLDAIGNL